MTKQVYCPLINTKIANVICFDISMVVEQLAPISTAPKEITKIKDYENICLKCPNHRDD